MKTFLKGQTGNILDQPKPQQDFFSAVKFALGLGIAGFVIFYAVCYLFITHETLPAFIMAGMFALFSSISAFQTIRTNEKEQKQPNPTETWSIDEDGFSHGPSPQIPWNDFTEIAVHIPKTLGAIKLSIATRTGGSYKELKAICGDEHITDLARFSKAHGVNFSQIEY